MAFWIRRRSKGRREESQGEGMSGCGLPWRVGCSCPSLLIEVKEEKRVNHGIEYMLSELNFRCRTPFPYAFESRNNATKMSPVDHEC